MITWNKFPEVPRPPGFCMDENGVILCQCAHWTRSWSRTLEKEYLKNPKSSLPHAVECDGKGNYVGKKSI